MKGPPSTQGNICNKSCLVTATLQKAPKLNQRLTAHVKTNKHKVKVAVYVQKHRQQSVIEQIQPAANNQGLCFQETEGNLAKH